MSAAAWLALTSLTRSNLEEHTNDYRSVQHRFALMLPFILAAKAA